MLIFSNQFLWMIILRDNEIDKEFWLSSRSLMTSILVLLLVEHRLKVSKHLLPKWGFNGGVKDSIIEDAVDGLRTLARVTLLSDERIAPEQMNGQRISQLWKSTSSLKVKGNPNHILKKTSQISYNYNYIILIGRLYSSDDYLS